MSNNPGYLARISKLLLVHVYRGQCLGTLTWSTWVIITEPSLPVLMTVMAQSWPALTIRQPWMTTLETLLECVLITDLHFITALAPWDDSDQ